MPQITTSSGKIRYKTIPLYLGVKKIDKNLSLENILILKTVLDRHQIPFLLIAGTLLGAVREGDFIEHDEDVDLAFLSENKQQLFDALPDILSEGFEIARYNRRGLLSIIRHGEYIDLYFFSPASNGRRTCDGWLVLETFLKDTDQFSFKGENFLVPREYQEYLLCEYGETWRIPIVWNNYTMPRWKRGLLCTKEYLKEALPDWIYFRLSHWAEQRNEAKSNERLNRYLKLKQKA